MSEIIVHGSVKFVGLETQVSASFKKRELVVTTDEQYPQHILINFTQDKCEYLDGLTLGQKVSISVNLRGREWVNPQGETKYFNDIQGWRVSKHTDANGNTHVQANNPVSNLPANTSTGKFDEEADDLPF